MQDGTVTFSGGMRYKIKETEFYNADLRFVGFFTVMIDGFTWKLPKNPGLVRWFAHIDGVGQVVEWYKVQADELMEPMAPPENRTCNSNDHRLSNCDSCSNKKQEENDLCTICHEEQKDLVMVVFTCGHLVCQTCSPLVKQCPQCRKDITQRIKVLKNENHKQKISTKKTFASYNQRECGKCFGTGQKNGFLWTEEPCPECDGAGFNMEKKQEDEKVESVLCSLCFKKRKKFVITCGHFVCELCSNTTDCAQCKTRIKDRIKVFN